MDNLNILAVLTGTNGVFMTNKIIDIEFSPQSFRTLFLRTSDPLTSVRSSAI